MGFRKRMRKHQLGHDDCRYLNRAIAKYGWENFKCETLFYCNLEQLDYYEKKFIALYDTCHGPGYNLTEGGGGVTGFKHSKEEIERIRKRSKDLMLQRQRKRRKIGYIAQISQRFQGQLCHLGKRYNSKSAGTPEEALDHLKNMVDDKFPELDSSLCSL